MSPSAHRPCLQHRSALAIFVSIAIAIAACASPSPHTASPAGSLSAWDASPFIAMERPVNLERLVMPPSEVVIDDDGALLHAVATVMTAPGELPRLERIDGEAAGEPLLLLSTHVRASMSGPVARVEIVQRYRNPSQTRIDATYVFPLPENSAVDAMRMTIGERELEAAIMERGAARRTFEAARDEGHTAALLEQQRPNVFSQSVANVSPGEDIEVVVTYVQELTWDAGRYEWTFPLVVGERFGVDARDPHLPPEQRVVPPVLGRGTRPGDVSIEVVADAGVPIHSIEVPTHEVDVVEREASRFSLRLQEAESLPNRDFVLRYEVGTPETRAALTTHHPGVGGAGYATLTLYPRYVDLEREIGEREFVFVVDVSGSMNGEPLAQCKEALQAALERLRPVDTFNVVTFANTERRLFDAPVPASTQNVRTALDALATMRAGGGTQLGSGIRAAFEQPPAEGRSRSVFVMTDGKINNEAEILELTRSMVARFDEEGQAARVFSLGVGYSPNRHLTEDLPAVGRGIAVQLAPGEAGAAAADRFLTVVDHAVLEEVTVDWGDLQVEAMHPATVPDLFASRPVVVHARYRTDGGAQSDTIAIHGELDGETVEIELEASLPAQSHGSSAERTLWARAAVETLESKLWRGLDPDVEGQIRALGLEHQIVTPFTSFVVVDPSPPVAVAVAVPVAEPEPLPASDDVTVSSSVVTAESQSVDDAKQETRSRGSKSDSGRIGGLVDTAVSGRRGSGASPGKSSRAEKRVKVTMSKPKSSAITDGELTASDVHKVFKKKRSAMQTCFERRLLDEPSVFEEGARLIIALTIGLDGQATDVVVTSTINDDALEHCIERVALRMRFPEPRDSVVKLKYPVRFEAEDND